MLTFEQSNTAFILLVVISFIIVLMVWTRVWGNQRNCRGPRKRLDPRCGSIIKIIWVIVAIGVTVGAVILTYIVYQKTRTSESPKETCLVSFYDPDCNLSEFCWDPPDTYAAACKTYCTNATAFEDEECLLVHCEQAISEDTGFWDNTDGHNKLINDCYDICYERVIGGFTTSCTNLICSQPVDDISPDLDDAAINDQCSIYCNSTNSRKYGDTCYLRTCGPDDDISTQCTCSRFVDICNSDDNQDCNESEACDEYCSTGINDNICSQYACIVDKLFGCGEPCVDNCLPDNDHQLGYTFRNKSTKNYAHENNSIVFMEKDSANETKFAYSNNSDKYKIHLLSNPSMIMHINNADASIYFAEGEGDEFIFISTGVMFEYYIRTSRLFNSGNNQMVPRSLGETTKRFSDGQCKAIMGIVPTPNKHLLNTIIWRFAPEEPQVFHSRTY